MDIFYWRALHFPALLLRLFLAMAFGGMIGMERERRKKAAGFRTYMLVCIGAALTMMLGQYLDYTLCSGILPGIGEAAVKTDVSRFSAQVINGIGFLGAGTILVTKDQAVKGVTTAAALWSSACMGLVIGAGFYECAVIGFALILLCIKLLPPLEGFLLRRSRNINLYVELQSIEDIRPIISFLKADQILIYDIDLDQGNPEAGLYPSAVLSLRQRKPGVHTQLIRELFCSAPIRRIVEL